MDSIKYEFESGYLGFLSSEVVPEETSELYSDAASEEVSEVSSEETSEVNSEETSEVSSEVVYTSTVDLSTIESELHEIKQGVGFVSLFFVMFFFIVVVYLVQNWLSHYF